MITLSMLSLGVVILLAAITVLSVVATQHPALQPATVDPFGPSIGLDASETLPTAMHSEGTLTGDWHTLELNRLSDVEDLMDTLEACHARAEVEIAGNERFTVRWR
jgi:hypothetical protein